MKLLFFNDKFPSFLAILLHDLFLICSFLISHPLISAYLLLLSPYILKLLFLIYPLIFSTFLLLLLALLTSSSSQFPLTTPSAILNFLHSKLVADECKSCLTDQICAMFFVDSQLNYYQLEPDSSEKRHVKVRKQHSRRTSEILQRDGSMRKEKEWKRTLACKLFEERMTYKLCEERKVFEGDEDMDLLWEAYEVDANKTEKQSKKEDDEEEEDDDQEKVMLGQFCCLQALKLSAGKMNLVKVSMALKGISVFRREGRRRRKINI